MKPKTAILLLDKLMLWHNINQRHPVSRHVTSLHDKHIYMTFPFPLLADSLIQNDTRACPGSNTQQHLQHDAYVRPANARLPGVTQSQNMEDWQPFQTFWTAVGL